MRVQHVTLLLISALIPVLAGAEDQANAAPAPASLTGAPEVQDLVYFGGARPVRIRLHIFLEGNPYRAAWNDFVQELFRYLDSDGNGVLDKKEAERVPRAQSLRELLRIGTVTSMPGRVTMAQLDNSPADGIVTYQEFARYFRRFGVTALQINYQQTYGAAGNPLTDALFKRLGADQDGTLSKDKLLRAHETLSKLDLDDDEMIAPEEIGPGLSPAGRAARPQQPGDGSESNFAYLPDDAPFVLLEPGESAQRLVQQLLARYDKDRNQKLGWDELGGKKEPFAQLDRNQDGYVDAEEATAFTASGSELVLSVRVGRAAAPPDPRGLFNPLGSLLKIGMLPATGITANPQLELAASVRQVDPRTVFITLDDAQLNLHVAERSPALFEGLRQTALQQFEAADLDKNGIVESAEAQNPAFQLLRAALVTGDRAGREALSKDELTQWLEIMKRGIAGTTHFTLIDNDRGLFELLDTNGDGFLGQRELRTAWARMAAWDRNRDGRIAADEIPRDLAVRLGQQGAPPGRSRELFMVGEAARRRPPAEGPAWFRKMDRNGDGDVSLREFLGTLADFKRIDANGDGLIDPEEASRADQRSR